MADDNSSIVRDPFEGMDLTIDSGSPMGRDPFEGLEVEAEVKQPPAPAAPESDSFSPRDGEPAAGPLYPPSSPREDQPAPLEQRVAIERPEPKLRGKGVWMRYSGDIELAIKEALAIGATHIFCKVGQRGMFFVEAARRLYDQVREAGLVPFAWSLVHCDDPEAEARTMLKAAALGYPGFIFDLADDAAGKMIGAAALGRQLLAAGIDPEMLYYSAYPNIWQHPDLPYKEMNEFCQGGLMPRCYPTFQRTARTVIDKWAYGEHARWSAEWGNMPPLYPILASYQDEEGTCRLAAQEFLEWAETLAAHEPAFFSVYHAGEIVRELWPILASMGRRPPLPAPGRVEPAPPPLGPVSEAAIEPEVPPLDLLQPVEEVEATRPVPRDLSPAPAAQPKEPRLAPSATYHLVTVNDSVWTICTQYEISREQFWEWNGHLWDQQGLPRDILYLQAGWRVRVG
ncbi:MAG: hypothetical protein JW900_08195 [Anaerolineae bacterium]|nr:hypothetical protein [Anaerolineae bacterium]